MKHYRNFHQKQMKLKQEFEIEKEEEKKTMQQVYYPVWDSRDKNGRIKIEALPGCFAPVPSQVSINSKLLFWITRDLIFLKDDLSAYVGWFYTRNYTLNPYQDYLRLLDEGFLKYGTIEETLAAYSREELLEMYHEDYKQTDEFLAYNNNPFKNTGKVEIIRGLLDIHSEESLQKMFPEFETFNQDDIIKIKIENLKRSTLRELLNIRGYSKKVLVEKMFESFTTEELDEIFKEYLENDSMWELYLKTFSMDKLRERFLKLEVQRPASLTALKKMELVMQLIKSLPKELLESKFEYGYVPRLTEKGKQEIIKGRIIELIEEYYPRELKELRNLENYYYGDYAEELKEPTRLALEALIKEKRKEDKVYNKQYKILEKEVKEYEYCNLSDDLKFEDIMLRHYEKALVSYDYKHAIYQAKLLIKFYFDKQYIVEEKAKYEYFMMNLYLMTTFSMGESDRVINYENKYLEDIEKIEAQNILDLLEVLWDQYSEEEFDFNFFLSVLDDNLEKEILEIQKNNLKMAILNNSVLDY